MDDVNIVNNSESMPRGASAVQPKTNYSIIILTVVVTLLLAGVGYLLYKRLQNTNTANQVQTTTISGSVQFTSLKPASGDSGTLKLLYRQSGTTNSYTDAGISIPLVNNQAWEWTNAEIGKTYDLKIALEIFGEEIKSSYTQTISAPANNVVLDLAIKWSDLPPSVVSTSDIPISGNIVINGSIPDDARVQVYAAAPNATDIGTMVFTKDKPTNITDWSWDQAIPLTKYSFTAVLLNTFDVPIGQSSKIVIAESADSRTDLTINSTYQPPAAKVSVNGTVKINGPIEPGSVLLITAKRPEDAAFFTIFTGNAPTEDKLNQWNWVDADSGQGYEFAAGIQLNNKYTAITAAKFITAPATNIEFTLNSNFSLGKPAGAVSVVKCDDSIALGFSKMTVTLPKVSGAGKYWLEIGSQSGSSDIYDNKITPDSGNVDTQVVVLNIKNNTNFYAKYSYSQSANSNDDSNFSPFSDPATVTCTGVGPR